MIWSSYLIINKCQMFDITFIHIMCFLIYIISIFLYCFYSRLFRFHVNGLPNNLLVFSFCLIYMSLVLATFISCPYKVKFIYLFKTANIVPPVLLFIANIAICISYSLVYIFHIDIALLDLNQSVLKMSLLLRRLQHLHNICYRWKVLGRP